MNHSAPKILYTASSSAHLVSFHLPYLAALRSLGWDVTAAANGSGEDLGEGVRFLAVPFTKSFASPKNFRAAALLARDIRKNRYDVIVTHTSLAAFFTRLGVMLAGKKHTRVVNTVHGYLFDGDSGALRRTVLLAAEKLTAGVTDDILVMNRCDEQIAKKHRLCRGNVYFIPGMGVDFSRFPPAAPEERAAAKAAYSLPEDAVCLVCAAEFSKRKNQTLLLQTLARLPENYYLLLPGDGALLQECKAEAETLGISSRCRFPGRISDGAPLRTHAGEGTRGSAGRLRRRLSRSVRRRGSICRSRADARPRRRAARADGRRREREHRKIRSRARIARGAALFYNNALKRSAQQHPLPGK